MRAGALAGLFAFGAYGLVAWPSAGWFDGGELVAATWSLGAYHPPGHPLYALATSPFLRLPLGPIALRAALGSAASMALATALVVGLVEAATEPFELRSSARAGWALAAAALFGASSLAVGQAVRPEVYALNAALVAGALLGAVRFVARRDARDLAMAGLFVGLGGANHHLLALLAVPSVLVAAWAETEDPPRARRGILAGAALGLAALLAYAFLPLRAGVSTSVVSPRTLPELWDVVTARVYQSAALGDAPGGLGTRLADVGVLLVLGTGGLFALLSLGGLYAMGRVRETRRQVAVLGLPVLLYPLTRAWLGFSRQNPDAEGYLLPALLAMASAVGILFVVGHALALRSGGEQSVRAGRGAAVLFVVLAALTGGLDVRAMLGRPRGPERGPDVYARTILEQAPPRAVLLLTSPRVYFALLGHRATESPRPDVSLLGLPFLAYPGRARETVSADASMRDFVRGYLLEGRPPETELAALAASRPVLLETDPHVGPSLRSYLTPAGPLTVVAAEPRTRADLVANAERHFDRWSALYERLGDEATKGETSNLFGWRHFQDALLFAAGGDREAAARSASLAARHVPRARELVRLQRAIGRGQGPIDVEDLQVRLPKP